MPDVPLTSYGLDSISAASMSYALRPILTVSQLQLLADLTLGDLERRLEAAAENESSGIAEQAKADVDTALQDKTREMVQLVEKYSSDLPQLKRVEFHADSAYILITGTTGTFGAHVLAQLLRTPQARKIYVFLRKNGDGTAAMERQTLAFKSRGLDISLLSSKNLVLLEGSFSHLSDFQHRHMKKYVVSCLFRSQADHVFCAAVHTRHSYHTHR